MNSLLAIYRFELKRVMTPGRIFWWFVVAAFPAAIILLMKWFIRFDPGIPAEEIDFAYTIALYFLAPSVACMLGALLMAAPAVANELEQHSWIYLATRPNGLFHLILGKYLVAVTWSASATIAGIIASVQIGPFLDATGTVATMSLLALFSAMSYAALYVMIGTLFHARAMVFCVAYTAAVELFLGLLPAVVNRLTVQFRLRTMLFHRIELPRSLGREGDDFWNFGVLPRVAIDESLGLQMLWLVAISAVFVCLALVSVQVREFTTARESEL